MSSGPRGIEAEKRFFFHGVTHSKTAELRMHRFFIPLERAPGRELLLEEAEVHHALHVLRLRPGDRVQVLNGAGILVECVVKSLAKRSVQLTVVRQEMVPRFPWQITLGQALPKGKTMDAIVQKATELGVGQIIPLLTERTEVHLEKTGQMAAKVEKWRAVAVESIKQCGSPWLPQIGLPMNLADFLAGPCPFDLKLVGCLCPGGRHLRDYWEEFWVRHRQVPRQIVMMIGPEGDFTLAELDRMKSLDFQPVSFGSLVLRCETAAIYGLSILNHELRYARS